MTSAQRVAMTARLIQRRGKTVTLPSGDTVKAFFCEKSVDVQKYVPVDAQLPGRGKMAIFFVFAGSLLGVINGEDTLVCDGVSYVAESPFYPAYDSDLCQTLTVVCYVP